MSHPLRLFFPGIVYEITTRTIQGRMLMRPSPVTQRRINGVIARGQGLYDVQVHGYAVMSNHWQILVSSDCGESMALFMGYVNGNIALECGRANNWVGPFWGRRCRPIPCLDHDAAVARLRYCIAQGVKEGLVDEPEQWPGASSTPGLLATMSVQGEWVDRAKARPARRAAVRKNQLFDEQRFVHKVNVVLSPLPGFANLDANELRNRHQALVNEVVSASYAARGGRPSLGVARVMSQDPHGAALHFVSTPSPPCHSSSNSLREKFIAMRSAVVAAYRIAAAAIRDIVSPRAAKRSENTEKVGPHKLLQQNGPSALECALNRIPQGMFACPRFFQQPRSAILWDIARLS
jgi:hypothetical protein